MSWDVSRPADADRIRISAGLIRNNFGAIFAGTVALQRLSLVSVGSFPALAGASRLYGYTNANSGQVEIQAVNTAGAIVKLTEGGRIGAIGQSAIFGALQCTSLKFDNLTPALTYGSSNLVIARGTVSSLGVISMALNMTSSQFATGKYTLTIPAGVMTSNSYQVMIQPLANSNSVFANLITKPAINALNPTVITLKIIPRTGGGEVDGAFDAMIIGGR